MTQRANIVIVGGGIAGLAAAHRVVTGAPAGAAPRVTVLERSDRLGGWIRTESFAGRPVDFGPDSLLVRTPWAAELCRELGIEDQLVAPGAGRSLIFARGQLRTLPPGILAGLPDGPMPFVRSGLLGPLGLLRAAADLVLPASAPPDGQDESIGALIRRRLGRQALERVIDPLLGGVHAGRCDELSLAATAPQIAAAARADRSLLRGLRKTAPPRPAAAPTAPAPAVFKSPAGGMQQLTTALISALQDAGVELRTAAPVATVDGAGSALTIVLEDGATITADGVVLAVPGAPAAQLIAPHAAAAADTLAGLRYASVAQVALEYDAASLGSLPDATGFLVARGEPLLITACTLLDAKWPQRRELGDGPPPESVVIKCSVGRSDDARFDAMDDAQLVSAIHGDLQRTLGLTAPPISSRVFRVHGGLAQYAPGHLERIAEATAEVEQTLPGVSLAGAAYTGSSVPQCVRSGRAAADAQLARLGLT